MNNAFDGKRDDVQLDKLAPLCRTQEERVARRISEKQNGIPTFFDQLLLGGIRRIRGLTATLAAGGQRRDWSGESEDELRKLASSLAGYAEFASRPRYTTFGARLQESEGRENLPWELATVQAAATQGVEECLHWRGVPIFKSAFDFAIYPMLIWEQKPRTILELGSGLGGSALWFSDLFRSFGMTGHVYSVDKNPVAMQSPGVTFINGDCYRIEAVLPRQFMGSLPHPWLLIEDVHVNTASILRHLIGLMEVGDYLVVEDAETKRPVVRSVLDQQQFCIRVDTRYTDFFGRNATSCVDGVLVRLADEPVLFSHRIL